MGCADHETAGLEGACDTGQCALGDACLLGDVTGLHLPEDPHHPQHHEAGPGQLGLPQHGVLHVLADPGGRPVDVGDGRHRLAPQRHIAELGLDGLLRLGEGTMTGHDRALTSPRRLREAGDGRGV
jgi:hypothetical protein